MGGVKLLPRPKASNSGYQTNNMHNGFAIMQVLTTVYQTNMVSFHPKYGALLMRYLNHYGDLLMHYGSLLINHCAILIHFGALYGPLLIHYMVIFSSIFYGALPILLALLIQYSALLIKYGALIIH